MIGEGYWSTGISVRYGYSGSGLYGWGAEVKFFDDGHAGDDDTDAGTVSTQGVLRTRYRVREGTGPDADGLTVAVDAVKADAERLGVWFTGAPGRGPYVYCESEGEAGDYPFGWRELVNAQSRRLGWQPLYCEGRTA